MVTIFINEKKLWKVFYFATSFSDLKFKSLIPITKHIKVQEKKYIIYFFFLGISIKQCKPLQTIGLSNTKINELTQQSSRNLKLIKKGKC